jgi:DNA-binding SARP family transcriptional activator
VSATVPAATVRLGLLGGFELLVEGRRVPLPLQAQRLVAFLALHERPLHRAYVSGRLWIDASQDQAHGCLRTTLWRMRGLRLPVVAATSTHLELAASVVVDARDLVASADRVLHGDAPSSADLTRLVRARAYLVDWYEDWVLEQRDQLRQLRLLALEAACEELVAQGRTAEALLAGLAATADDPLRESAVRALVAAHLAAGNVAEALRRYDAYRSQLAARLHLEPTLRITELMRSVASPGGGDPASGP